MEELLKQVLVEIKEIKATMATKDDVNALKQKLDTHHIQNIEADEKLLSEIKSVHDRLDHQIGRIAKTEESLDILQKKLPQ